MLGGSPADRRTGPDAAGNAGDADVQVLAVVAGVSQGEGTADDGDAGVTDG